MISNSNNLFNKKQRLQIMLPTISRAILFYSVTFAVTEAQFNYGNDRNGNGNDENGNGNDGNETETDVKKRAGFKDHK